MKRTSTRVRTPIRFAIGLVIGLAFWILVARLLLFALMGGGSFWGLEQGSSSSGSTEVASDAMASEPSEGSSESDQTRAAPPAMSYGCRVMGDPINALAFMAFGGALALLFGRSLDLKQERRAFGHNILAGSTDTLVLPEDAQELRRRFNDAADVDRSLVVNQLVQTSLQRARANWSAEDVGAAVHSQADLLQGQVEADYSIVRYLAWAIPSIGFIGTVLGIGKAMGAFQGGAENPIDQAATHLNTAFDTTFVALVLSLILMYFVHRAQAEEDSLIVDAVNWCMKNFVHRMHIK